MGHIPFLLFPGFFVLPFIENPPKKQRAAQQQIQKRPHCQPPGNRPGQEHFRQNQQPFLHQCHIPGSVRSEEFFVFPRPTGGGTQIIISVVWTIPYPVLP